MPHRPPTSRQVVSALAASAALTLTLAGPAAAKPPVPLADPTATPVGPQLGLPVTGEDITLTVPSSLALITTPVDSVVPGYWLQVECKDHGLTFGFNTVMQLKSKRPGWEFGAGHPRPVTYYELTNVDSYNNGVIDSCHMHFTRTPPNTAALGTASLSTLPGKALSLDARFSLVKA